MMGAPKLSVRAKQVAGVGAVGVLAVAAYQLNDRPVKKSDGIEKLGGKLERRFTTKSPEILTQQARRMDYIRQRSMGNSMRSSTQKNDCVFIEF